MSASPAYSIRLTCSDASSSGSSQASSPSQPLVSPFSGSNIDISLHTVSNIIYSNQNTIENKSLILSQAVTSLESQSCPTTIRLSLLKHSTEPEISLLLRSALLVTLRKWCEKALVKTIGLLNHKVSLSVPLSTTFWSYYLILLQWMSLCYALQLAKLGLALPQWMAAYMIFYKPDSLWISYKNDSK